jgi:hypothetical protein
MLFIEQMILNFIYLLFPILCYFFYVTITKDLNKKENNIIFEVTLFLSLYFIIKYADCMTSIKPIILFNVPLLLAYIKNKKIKSYYYVKD